MEELKLTGNHLNGSRPLLTFSTNFDKDPRWKLLKEMIMQVFKSLSLVAESLCNLSFYKIYRASFFCFLKVAYKISTSNCKAWI